MATLSANLTRSGWWENVESGHVEVINAAGPGNQRCTFREDLLEALRLLAENVPEGDRGGPLEKIRQFLELEAPRGAPRFASWAGRFYTRLFVGQRSLGDWLRDLGFRRKEWNLEVISPFFDGNGAGALKELIDAVRPREVRVFLPTEADGTPAVTEEQFEAVATLASWSRLPESITLPAGRQALQGAFATARPC